MRLVAGERSVLDDQGRAGSGNEEAVVQVGDGAAPAVAAIAAVLGGAAVGALAAVGEVVGESAVRHRGLAATSIRDGPAECPAAVAGAGVGTDGLVVGKRAVCDAQGRAGVVRDPAARGLASADRLVAGERAVIDGQGRAEDIRDGAAAAIEADDLVVGQGHVGDDQVAAVIEDAAAQGDGAQGAHHRGSGGAAISDRQTSELDVRRAAADVKHPGGVIAANRQVVLAPTLDRQVVRDAQLAAQRDGPMQATGEPDQVGTGVEVGVEDRLPQRIGAAVGEVVDREGAQDGPILQPFDAQSGAARDRLRSRVGRCPFSMPDGTKRERVDRSQDDIRIARTPWEDWSAIQWKDIVPGADRAQGRCRAGEGLAWR